MRSTNLLALPFLLVMAPAFADIMMPNSVNCGGATQITYDSGGTACIANGSTNTPPAAGAVSGSPTPTVGTTPSTGVQPAATPAPVAAAPVAAAPATVPAVTPPIAAGLAAPAAAVAGASILSDSISGMAPLRPEMQQYFPQSNFQPQIDSLRNQIVDVQNRGYAGTAAAIAHSSLQSVPLGKDHSLSAALGAYGGQSAVAFGLSSKLNDGWSSRFSIARDRYQTSFGASGAYSW